MSDDTALGEALLALASGDFLTDDQIAVLEAADPGCCANARRRKPLPVAAASPREVVAPRGAEVPRDLPQSAAFPVSKKRFHDASRVLAAGYTGTLTLHGPALEQEDFLVLLALLEFHRGKSPDEWLEFTPRAFARDMLGKCDHKKSKENLLRSLLNFKSLQIIRAWTPGAKPAALSLLRDFEAPTADSPLVRLRFHPTVMLLFKGLSDEQTRLSLKDLRQLKVGLETWLYCFVRSSDCTPAPQFRAKGNWTLEWFHERSGSIRSIKNFRTDLRHALDRLRSLGFIHDYRIEGHDVRIRKHGPKTIKA